MSISTSLLSGWIALVAFNLVVQLLYFFRDESRSLFLAKKITTPLLLFAGLVILAVEQGRIPLVPGLVLGLMGIGELGIEGSKVVESGNDRIPGPLEAAIVFVSGLIFPAVNLLIGIFLLLPAGTAAAAWLAGAAAAVAATDILVIRRFRPSAEVRFQLSVYSVSLAVLGAGAVRALLVAPSALGLAALVLTVSDSLVLLRMGAGLQKGTRRGFILLLLFLTAILLLYYFYMALMIWKVR